MDNCLNILNKRASMRGLNHTNITLIPKVSHPRSAADFDPTSLYNVSYKIIAKVLTNRLKRVLNVVISNAQSALFQAG